VVAINPAVSESKTPFRWKYVILPVALCLLTIILAVCFYPYLSSEVAYHFNGDAPDKWLTRESFIAWMIIPQVIFTVLALVIVRMASMTTRYIQSGSSTLEGLLAIMGNMLALPELAILFALVYFFLYNAYQIKLISLWLIICIILIVGAVILAILFIRAVRRARRKQAKTSQE
jgi:uncharacterized membrane protein